MIQRVIQAQYIKAVCTFLEFFKSKIKSFLSISENSITISLPDNNWYKPRDFAGLYKLLGSESLGESRVKMVASNTGSGIYKEYEPFDKFIDLKGIQELSSIHRNSEGISIGAAVSISETIEALRKETKKKTESSELIFAKIADHMSKVASSFVRNTASLGGNLIMSQTNQFASDIAAILLAVGSIVCLQMPLERVVLSLEFLERPPCDNKTILVSIQIPSQNFTIESNSRTNGQTSSVSANVFPVASEIPSKQMESSSCVCTKDQQKQIWQSSGVCES